MQRNSRSTTDGLPAIRRNREPEGPGWQVKGRYGPGHAVRVVIADPGDVGLRVFMHATEEVPHMHVVEIDADDIPGFHGGSFGHS